MSTPAPFTFTGSGKATQMPPEWVSDKEKYYIALDYTPLGSMYPSKLKIGLKKEAYESIVNGSYVDVTCVVSGYQSKNGGIFNNIWLIKWAAAKPPVASTDELSVEDLERLLAEKRAAAANPAPAAAPATTTAAEPLDDLPF